MSSMEDIPIKCGCSLQFADNVRPYPHHRDAF